MFRQNPPLNFFDVAYCTANTQTYTQIHIFWCNDFPAPVVSCQQTCWNLLSNPRCGKYPCKPESEKQRTQMEAVTVYLSHVHTQTEWCILTAFFPPDILPRHDLSYSKTPTTSILQCFWCLKESMCLHLLVGEGIYVPVCSCMSVRLLTLEERTRFLFRHFSSCMQRMFHGSVSECHICRPFDTHFLHLASRDQGLRCRQVCSFITCQPQVLLGAEDGSWHPSIFLSLKLSQGKAKIQSTRP